MVGVSVAIPRKTCRVCRTLLSVLDKHSTCVKCTLCCRLLPCAVCKSWSVEQWDAFARGHKAPGRTRGMKPHKDGREPKKPKSGSGARAPSKDGKGTSRHRDKDSSVSKHGTVTTESAHSEPSLHSHTVAGPVVKSSHTRGTHKEVELVGSDQRSFPEVELVDSGQRPLGEVELADPGRHSLGEEATDPGQGSLEVELVASGQRSLNEENPADPGQPSLVSEVVDSDRHTLAEVELVGSGQRSLESPRQEATSSQANSGEPSAKKTVTASGYSLFTSEDSSSGRERSHGRTRSRSTQAPRGRDTVRLESVIAHRVLAQLRLRSTRASLVNRVAGLRSTRSVMVVIGIRHAPITAGTIDVRHHPLLPPRLSRSRAVRRTIPPIGGAATGARNEGGRDHVAGIAMSRSCYA